MPRSSIRVGCVLIPADLEIDCCNFFCFANASASAAAFAFLASKVYEDYEIVKAEIMDNNGNIISYTLIE
jgi:hypothetical protein